MVSSSVGKLAGAAITLGVASVVIGSTKKLSKQFTSKKKSFKSKGRPKKLLDEFP